MYHSLLNRQLKKDGLDKNELPFHKQWRSFLERVNRAYSEADQERYLMERSLMISSQEMQEVHKKLRESETRYALAAKGANDGLWDWDLVSEEYYYSPRWLEILGIESNKGQTLSKAVWFDRIHPADDERVRKELATHLRGETKHFENEHRVLHNDGEYRWVLSRGLAVRDEDGRACRIAGSLTDITKRKLVEEKLEHDAIHDALTGLPNRTRLMQNLTQSLERIKVDPNYFFAVIFIDLDRFKNINDSMGHLAGDELLLKFADKLRHLVRPTDMVARLGGDEFVILLKDIESERHALSVSQRLLDTFQNPTEIAGVEIYSSASVGIALGNSDYQSAHELLRDADIAMYRAKINGKSKVEVFDSHMHSGAVSKMQLEIDLRRAHENEEFVLHFQPIVLLDSEKVIGFESLVRWNHPTRGLVPPNEFIPVAEETGLIVPVGDWILRESCRQMSEWQQKYQLSDPLFMSVNLSARQIEQQNLAGQIAKILRETELPPNCLRLEITESVIMNNAEQAVITVNELRKMGVRVSIDDFGTGFSSLGYLHRFPVDTLKVDRSFINRIGRKGENAEIVQTIITLAYNLNMDVVAEGVETLEQLDFLRKTNCNYGQGYYYSKPLDKIAAAKLIEELRQEDEGLSPITQNKPDQPNELVH